MRLSNRPIVIAVALGAAACAGPVATLTSTPAGARVVREICRPGERSAEVVRTEAVAGVTKMQMKCDWSKLQPDEKLRLRFEKDGFFPEVRELERGKKEQAIHVDLREAPYAELWTPTIVFPGDGSFHYAFRMTRAFISTNEKEGVVPDRVVDAGDDSYFSSLHAAPDGNLLYTRHEIERDRAGAPSCRVANIYSKGIDDDAPPSRITDGFINLDATYSPDRRWIYMASNRLGNQFDIVRVPVTPPLNFTLVTSGDANEVGPCFEPRENGLMAYAAYPRSSSQPRTWAIGLNPQGYPTELREGHAPAISPDGKTIAFIGSDGHLWTMSATGNGQTQLSFGTASTEQDPAWSPDGKWPLFVSNQGVDEYQSQNNDVWVYSLERKKTTQLTINGSDDRSPVFSRDGKHVLFVSNRGQKWGIWRIAIDPDALFGGAPPPAAPKS